MKWKRGKKAQQEARLAAQQQLKQQQTCASSGQGSQASGRLCPMPLVLGRPSAVAPPASHQSQAAAAEPSRLSLLPAGRQASGPQPAGPALSPDPPAERGPSPAAGRPAAEDADFSATSTEEADADTEDHEGHEEQPAATAERR